ncbi:hypothetical protein, partial [Klebsiella pneumoniae]|uniref:hypothetical protein n=1 Tax=Klebsiella pneumoniae TaxID=573 RepID=UPI0015F2D966
KLINVRTEKYRIAIFTECPSVSFFIKFPEHNQKADAVNKTMVKRIKISEYKNKSSVIFTGKIIVAKMKDFGFRKVV